MIRIVPATVLAAALLFFPACGQSPQKASLPSQVAEEGAGSAAVDRTVPPAASGSTFSVRIVPEVAPAGTRLHLLATGFSLAEGSIEWKADGDRVPGRNEEWFPTEGMRKGTSVQARVRVGEREIQSNVARLANGLPGIRSVRIVPENIRPGDSIAVEASGSDPDGDNVTFEYAWEKNGLPAGTGSRLEGALKRGDAISVRITPFDGEGRGSFLVVRREVLNYPPSIGGMFDAHLANGVYTVKVGATDGDGDPLTYALAEAPPGMTIDPKTGAIRWSLPDGFLGSVPVTVSVDDGHGGVDSYPTVLTIREERPSKE